MSKLFGEKGEKERFFYKPDVSETNTELKYYIVYRILGEKK